MKTYTGYRSVNCVLVHEPGKPTRPLAPRWDLRNHSPDGFNWGYGGSGPAQLALALAADLLSDDEALAVYQQLKWQLIAGLVASEWTLTEDQIRQFLSQLQAEQE